jgi:hypothetical protein
MEHILHNISSIIMTMFMIGFAALFYLIPAFIAFARGHPHRYALFWLNLFLGWSGIVWFGALIWAIAISVEDERSQSSPGPSASDAPRRKAKPASDPITERGHPLL